MKKKGKFYISKFLVFAFMTFFSFQAFALDYIDSFKSFSDTFAGFTDKNAGSTIFPSLNIPSGGREESLGSALTALCDDIGFFDYNPAASCVLKNSELALFHNSWIADSNIETIAATRRFNNLGLGAKLKCFYVPFTEYNDFGDRMTSNYYSETTGVLNASYNFFNGYYFKGLAVGANLKASWRSIPDYTERTTGELIKKSGLSQSAVAIMADCGILLRFNVAKFFADRDANFKIGLSVTNAGIAFTGFGRPQGVELDDSLPTAFNAGLSYKFAPFFTVCLDFKQPLNLLDFSKTELWSCGIGLDVQITDFLELMAGFRLKGANPRISLGTEIDLKQFTLDLNYTFDLTSSINPINHFSVGAKINFGDHGRFAKELEADYYYEEGIKYYAQGKMEEAVENWNKCLELNPSFTPALNNIKLVKKSTKLFDRVIDIQSLE